MVCYEQNKMEVRDFVLLSLAVLHFYPFRFFLYLQFANLLIIPAVGHWEVGFGFYKNISAF